MENHEVTSSQFPWNMAGWCSEKSGNVVHELATLMDYFKRLEHLKQKLDTADERAHGDLYSAIFDATKIFAFSCGATWSVDDPEIITKRGKRGYIELAIKYGQITETATSYAGIDDDIALRELVEELESLLRNESRSNRTLIHDALRKAASRRDEIERIRELTDKVSMGELSWDDYRGKVFYYLDYLRSELSNEN